MRVRAEADGPGVSAKWTPRHLSLGAELHVLVAAVDGARILADELAMRHLASERDERAVPDAISAILSFVAVRGTDLGRVVRREKDPAALLTGFNTTDSTTPDDLTIPAWDPDERRAHAHRELRRADHDRNQKRRKTTAK